MSKYVLAKDLPFAKAGTDVWIDNTWTAWIDGDVYFPTAGICEFRKGKIMLGKIGNLKIEGWIEKVEPREFYVAINKETGVMLENQKPTDKAYQDGWTNIIEVIKVREVL